MKHVACDTAVVENYCFVVGLLGTNWKLMTSTPFLETDQKEAKFLVEGSRFVAPVRTQNRVEENELFVNDIMRVLKFWKNAQIFYPGCRNVFTAQHEILV